MSISVIIPAYNEESTIVSTIASVFEKEAGYVEEVLVVDGGSRDRTVQLAGDTSASVLRSPEKGRAAQMNFGAKKAQGEILYFLHADTRPPEGFDQKIITACENGAGAGCFQLTFDSSHPVLGFYSWCTRFDIDAFRFGDQSLFAEATLFRSIGGFREDHIVMEDNEIVSRLKSNAIFRILPEKVVTSARKYNANGVFRLQVVFTLIFLLYKAGMPQAKLLSVYQKLIQ